MRSPSRPFRYMRPTLGLPRFSWQNWPSCRNMLHTRISLPTYESHRIDRTLRMAKVRKREWVSGGETKSAYVADYFDGAGKRHIKTFKTRKAAEAWLVQTR